MILEKDIFDENKYIEIKDDLIIAHGGDGTLLKAINRYKHLNLTFAGLANGTKNFLMNETKLNEHLNIIELNLINAEIKTKNTIINIEAFNEVMIGGDMNAWIHFDVEEIGSFSGGGLIISTAQGSTGINKSNNGPILPLNTDMWSITGDKTNKKISFIKEPTKLKIKFNSRRSVSCWLDGENNIIDEIEEIILTKGSVVKLAFNDINIFKNKRF